jgi:hypothetical protein
MLFEEESASAGDERPKAARAAAKRPPKPDASA